MEKVGTNDSLDELLGEDTNEQQTGQKDELDELLGSSDEEGVDGDKPGNKQDELNDLLGDSEGEEATEESPDHVKVEAEGTERFDELEQILGKMEAPKATLRERAKTTAKLVLSETYKVPGGHKSLFVRTPNFIKIQANEYDEPLYNAVTEREQFSGSTAVVRWRTKRDDNGNVILDSSGQPVKESNARMIQWADGSVQLVVGDAVFQCKNVDVDNCYVYENRPVQVLEGETNGLGNEDRCLECIGGVPQRLVLQPMSLDSESHARMSMKISEKHKKESKIGIRDYEQIKERPEETLARIAREEEEVMRRDRKIKQQREYASGSAANTITGNARYVRRPTMSEAYLAANGYDDEDGEVGDGEPVDYGRDPKQQKPKVPQQKSKAQQPKRKAPSDYQEYDEEEGSEADEEDDEDAEDDNSEMEDDVDDDEDEEEEAEESGEESEEGDEEGASGESDADSGDEAPRSRSSKSKAKEGSREKGGKDKADKGDKKKSKADKKERRRLKEERRQAKKDKRRTREEDRERSAKPAESRKTKRAAASDSEGERPTARAADKAAAGTTSGAEEEGDDDVNVQQRKRIKRTIIDSDEDE